MKVFSFHKSGGCKFIGIWILKEVVGIELQTLHLNNELFESSYSNLHLNSLCTRELQGMDK